MNARQTLPDGRFRGVGLQLVRLLAGLFAILTLCAVSVALVAGTALRDRLLDGDAFRLQLEERLSKTVGEGSSVSIGSLRIRPDPAGLVAVRLNDVRLRGASFSSVELGRVELGLRLLPLLRERVEIARASVANVMLDASYLLGSAEETDWNAMLARLDLSAVSARASRPLNSLERAFRRHGLDTLTVTNVRIAGLDRLPLRSRTASLRFVTSRTRR